MRKGECKFYNGTMHNTHCNAGVCYRDVIPEPDNTLGIAFRTPCYDMTQFSFAVMNEGQAANHARRGTCKKYTEPTLEEIAKDDAEIEAMFDKLITYVNPIVRRIKSEHKGIDWRGVETCPICQGKLHLTHAAYNGHVHGSCETKDCLRWME